MAVIHISEEAASNDLGSLVDRASQGDEIVITGSKSSAKLVAHGRPKPRSGAEILAILESLPGERSVMDADFARDIRQFRESHPESALRLGELDAELQMMGMKRQVPDLIIAATAPALGYKVATRNIDHFSHIPGLRIATPLPIAD